MDIETAKKILEGNVWEHPSDYGGFSPDGHYCVYSQNAGSGVLESCNYKRFMEKLQVVEKTVPGPEDDLVIEGLYEDDTVGSWVYDWRAKHWACGWVEYLMVHPDSPEAIIIEAAKITLHLKAYPVVDEDAWSEAEMKEADRIWNEASVGEKIEWCQKSDISIFSARQKGGAPMEVFDFFRGYGYLN